MERLDATGFFSAALEAYRAQEIAFDAVYTGYLCSPAQAAAAADELRRCGAALRVTDPAMADNGRLYGGFGPEMVEAMQTLCGEAGLITPKRHRGGPAGGGTAAGAVRRRRGGGAL